MDSRTEKLLAEASPPQAVESEAWLLGAAMCGRDVAEQIASAVPLEAFYSPKHRPIYRAIAAALAAGENPDPLVVAARLVGTGEIAAAGGGPYIAELRLEAITGGAGWESKAAHVTDAFQLRKILGEAVGVVKAVYDNHRPAELLDHWAAACRDLMGFGSSRKRATPAAELAKRTKADVVRLAHSGEEPSLPFGMPDLDRMAGGLFPAEFSVVAARPSQGKSAFAWQVACNVARSVPVLLVSLEMPQASLAHRHFAERSGISSLLIRTGRLEESELRQLEEPAAHLASLKLHVKDDPSQTVADIRTELMHLEREYDGTVPLCVVDYLQLVTPPNKRAARFEQVSQISSELRRLARETGTHVMALSQINRAAENRTDKQPGISDIRESGNIEQDADTILLIHNPIPEGFVETTEAKIIVGKCRNGVTGAVVMQFRRAATRFECKAREHHPPPAPPKPKPSSNGYHAARGWSSSEMPDNFDF